MLTHTYYILVFFHSFEIQILALTFFKVMKINQIKLLFEKIEIRLSDI